VVTLIRAAAPACVKLHIVGAEGESLHRLAGQTGGDVEFCGYQSGSALRAAFVSARAVAVPSECHENTPLSVVEKSAPARAVIGARIGGIPEFICERENGFLFDSSVEALTAVLERVQALSDSALALRPARRRRAAQVTVAGARGDERCTTCGYTTIPRTLRSIRLRVEMHRL